MRKIVTEIQELVGEEISAVAFVCDYVELHFGGPVLRSISNPSITIEGMTFRFPEPGSRDALCRAIGSTIRALNLEDDLKLELLTTNDFKITIPLDMASSRGGEAMHFMPEGGGGIQVW